MYSLPAVKLVMQLGHTGMESLVAFVTQAPSCSSQHEMTKTLSIEHPSRFFRASI